MQKTSSRFLDKYNNNFKILMEASEGVDWSRMQFIYVIFFYLELD